MKAATPTRTSAPVDAVPAIEPDAAAWLAKLAAILANESIQVRERMRYVREAMIIKLVEFAPDAPIPEEAIIRALVDAGPSGLDAEAVAFRAWASSIGRDVAERRERIRLSGIEAREYEAKVAAERDERERAARDESEAERWAAWEAQRPDFERWKSRQVVEAGAR